MKLKPLFVSFLEYSSLKS